jgi:hypothetical protein
MREGIVVKTTYLILGSTIMLVLAAALLSSCTREKVVKEEDLGFTIKTPEIGEVLSATSIWRAYLANKQSADLAYRNKIIQVKGKIRFFTPRRKKEKETCYIILEKDSSSRSFIKGVQCEFIGNINDIAPDIKIGDEITIRGTCIGKVVNVFLENCAIGDNPLPLLPEKPVDPLTVIKPHKEGEVILAYTLWSDYLKGILKADEVYYKKVLKVKGNVLSFGPPRFYRGNTSFIILEADLTSKSTLRGVQCEFDGNVLEKLPNLKKGDELIIEGIGGSKFFNVFLKKCRIVKDAK